ncbi:MAG TPA: hypothetical protein PLT66_05365, partial [Bacillota bacterium]|nr:hypothetical protein [Bacillota bacterium]
SFWLYALSTLLGAAAFAVCFASGKLKTKRQAAKKENTTKNTVFRISLILVTGTVMAASSLFNLTGARTMDAAVLYPMVTGGTITLTSLAGWLIYKEKASTASIISVVVSLTGTVLFAL